MKIAEFSGSGDVKAVLIGSACQFSKVPITVVVIRNIYANPDQFRVSATHACVAIFSG
jgi:hypothetical protein